MDNQELNTALYEKLFAEQEKFRDWLLTQPPNEILNHAYEYTVREDIVMAMEYHDLSDEQAAALLDSPTPLADVFKDFENIETNHMDNVRDCIESRADTELQRLKEQRETPLYLQTARYATEHGEQALFRASHNANVACRDAIEDAIKENYDGSHLNTELRYAQPNKKKRDYPLRGKAFCGCCKHSLARTMQKTSYYFCRHSMADENSLCHGLKVNAEELEQAVFLTLKTQMEAAAPLDRDGHICVDALVPEKAEYERQIEALQTQKMGLYEKFHIGEIDLDTYKTEKAACDDLLLKTKNAYAAVAAQAKQKQEAQSRQDNRQEAAKAIFGADKLTTELADLLIERVDVYPGNRIEITYKVNDIFE